MLADWRDRLEAVRDSLTLQYEGLADAQFVRYCAYLEIKRLIARAGLRDPEVLEIGHSNQIIASYLSARRHVVTGHYPAVDVCDMPQIAGETYDVVILDQVLEHVLSPDRAVAEIHRVLRPGGYAILATPFLIRIHGSPNDYWRYTEQGLRHLLREFRDVEIGQWGNRFTLKVTMRQGWLSTWATRRRLQILLKNEAEWPIVLWAFCRK